MSTIAPTETETTMSTVVTEITHAVYATTADGTRVRVTDPGPWGETIDAWNTLDDQRRAKQFPHVRFFEVRQTDDPSYADAPLRARYGRPITGQRGHRWIEDAASKAWKIAEGPLTPNGYPQGSGGCWFYRSGAFLGQNRSGVHHAVNACLRRGLVTQGVNGRWYVTVKVDN